MKYFLVIPIFALAFLLSGCSYQQKECIKSHEEEYYDSSGTSLWVATKNPGFLVQNGWKIRTVCDEYKTLK